MLNDTQSPPAFHVDSSDSLNGQPCHHLIAQITASSWSHLDQLRCVRRMYNTLLCSTGCTNVCCTNSDT